MAGVALKTAVISCARRCAALSAGSLARYSSPASIRAFSLS
jgi:hypothetical protein